jgi:hypothetical protein
VDGRADLTFNQLLGINDSGRISGYFGSGADAMHPNKGYQVGADHTTFINENFRFSRHECGSSWADVHQIHLPVTADPRPR